MSANPDAGTVKIPFRPALLVIAAAQDHEALSLGELVGRHYSAVMQRLTEKFSQRHWDIQPLHIDSENAVADGWAGMEESNMAVLAGYTGAAEQKETLRRLKQTSNPVVTLVSLSGDGALADAGLSLFDKAVSAIVVSVDEQLALVDSALRHARHETAVKPAPEALTDGDVPPPSSPGWLN